MTTSTEAAWLLIIIVHGWGAGVGSAGNAVAVASFHDKLACESARGAILIADDKYIGRAPVMVCVPQ